MSCYYCGKENITNSQHFPCETCKKIRSAEKKIRQQYFENIIIPRSEELGFPIYIRGLVFLGLIKTT